MIVGSWCFVLWNLDVDCDDELGDDCEEGNLETRGEEGQDTVEVDFVCCLLPVICTANHLLLVQ